MYTKDDILAALQNGEDPTKIANDFAAMLNAAVAEKEEADAKETAKVDKINRADGIVTVFLDFLEDYYPEMYDDEMRTHITGADLVEGIDQAIAEFKALKDSFGQFLDILGGDPKVGTIFNGIEPMVHSEKKPLKNKLQEGLDPIMDFLKDNGLA